MESSIYQDKLKASKEEDFNNGNYVDFAKIFEKLIEKHKTDEDYDLIKDYPKIFSLITDIASDRNSDGITKVIMNSAISYFILTVDVIPEKEFGIKGYIDDFYICLHALKRLLEYDQKQGEYLISKHWKLEEDYNIYIHKKYYQLMSMIDRKIIINIYSYSGMGFVEEFILFKKDPRTYSEKKIRQLEKQLDYCYHLFFNRSPMNNEAKKEFETHLFGTENFAEFVRKIDLLSKSDNNFRNSKKQVDEMIDIEERIKRAKLKRIFKWTA